MLPNDPIARAAFFGFLCVAIAVLGVFSYWYVKYDRIIEQRFRGPVFTNSARIYASPEVVKVGEKFTPKEIGTELRRAGYSENGESPLGTYRVRAGSIEISPGAQSYHSQESAT